MKELTDKQSIKVDETYMVMDNGVWKPLYLCLLQPRGAEVWFTQSSRIGGDLLHWNEISPAKANALIQETEKLLDQP